MNAVVRKKIERLADGEPPRVLDLFAGCGGISLGFQRAGFRIDAAVEADELAAQSHAQNFHNGDASHARARDILKTEPAELTLQLGLGAPQHAFDIVVGGPPCQAYARVGRAKLREIAEHPDAFRRDARANLYVRYLHYVACTKPLGLLMENVPDIMNFGGKNVAQEICEALEELGYEARYTLTNASHHGVPQFRDRVFLVAWRRELMLTPSFPQPTHHEILPTGYGGTRAVALKHVDLLDGAHFLHEQTGQKHLAAAITAEQALSDLPPITAHLDGTMKRGARRFDVLARYARGRPSDYAAEMRDWKGFKSEDGVLDHVIRLLPRDAPIFRAMKHGDEYPAAHATAMALFERELRKIERRDGPLSRSAQAALLKSMVPPYPLHSFPNRWWKLRPDTPVRTLLAHLGKDSYTHIHYDSEQARTISVREAARLQSFPDGFVFCGTMNPAFRQIGNAVPPLMAWRIARHMRQQLREVARGTAMKAA